MSKNSVKYLYYRNAMRHRNAKPHVSMNEVEVACYRTERASFQCPRTPTHVLEFEPNKKQNKTKKHDVDESSILCRSPSTYSKVLTATSNGKAPSEVRPIGVQTATSTLVWRHRNCARQHARGSLRYPPSRGGDGGWGVPPLSLSSL